MWIKSQDKRKLIKTSYIGVSDECKREVVAMNEYDGFIVGRYETEERTMQVIDSAYRAIKNGKTTYSMPEK